ncbi:Menaquinone reductase, integral membrane subunit [Anaerolineae bacterium]|nr:Menaquinone reductase, integral membrane subunit [Anaerolineae bacterium]
MKNFRTLLWLFAIVGFVAGAYGLYDRFATGHTNVSYGSYIPWGLWIGAYIYLVGISAGAFLISALVYAFGIKKLEKIGKLALFTAVISLAVAMFSVFLDLGRPERAWRLMFATNFGSMMGWMIWLYTAYFVLLLVELWFALRADFVAWSARKDFAGKLTGFLTFGQKDVSADKLARDKKMLRVLGTVGVPLAIAFHGGVGALFGVVGARPYWNTGLTPIMFLVGALCSGGALLTFVTFVFGPNQGSAEHKETVLFLGKIALGLLMFDVLLEWAEYSIGLYSAIPADVASMKLVLFGPYAWVFWGVHIGLGVVVPLLLMLFQPKSAFWVAVAGLLIAVTFFTVRLNIVIPGLAVPEIQGLGEAFSGPGLTFDYLPTLTEWLVQIWAISAGLLAFLIGYQVLPIVREQSGAGAAAE